MKVIDPKESLKQNRLILRQQQRWDQGSQYGFRLPTGALCFHSSTRRRLALLAGLALAPLFTLIGQPPGIDVPTDRHISAVIKHRDPASIAQTLRTQLPGPYAVESQGLGRYLLISPELPLRVVIQPDAQALRHLLPALA